VERAERELFAAFPDIRFEGEELLLDGDRAVITATVTGTDEGGRLSAAGASFRVPVVLLCTIRDGYVVAERRLWDFSGFLLQRVQRDLDVAAEVQRLLLPRGRFARNGFEVDAASVPARTIGGDFFDYLDLPSGAFALVLGDVAGKGPPAALLGASLQAILGTHALSEGPATAVDAANRAMLRRAVPSRFATVVYAVLSSDGRLTYCNAGHNPPLLIGQSGRRWLQRGGTVLGVFDRAEFEEETIQLGDGDRLVVFSDGVVEAQGEDGTEFGEERLAACVEANQDMAPAALVGCVIETVRRFAGGKPQHDDLTVLVLSYTHG
jgi:sigma-B regulation protein RsbU (phosphoserine phosphatase)